MKPVLMPSLTILLIGAGTAFTNAQQTMNYMETNQTIENKAAITATAFGWFRKDVPLSVAHQYWRDIHGVLAARIPGLYQYRQMHLSPVKHNLFDAVNGISYDLPKEDQPNGIAQLLFLSQKDVETFGTHPFVTQYIYEDEQNLCERNAHQWSPDHSAVTVKDVTNEGTPQGPSTHPAFVIGFKKTAALPVKDFNNFIVQQLVPAWAGAANVLRLRYHLLEPYVEHEGQSPNVLHHWEAAKQYQVWIELELREEKNARELMNGFTTGQLQKNFSAIHAFPVYEKYTLVYNGRPTEVGYRGYPATQIIAKAGARNQQQQELLSALYEQTPADTSAVIKQRNIQSVKNFLRFLEEKNMDQWKALWAEDGINYYPYHSGMFAEVMKGREVIFNYWKTVPDMFDSLSFPIHEILADETGNTITIRFDSHNIMKGGKGRYDNTYVCIFKFNKDGKIREYYEYFNPITTGVTYGMLKVERIK